MRQRIVVVLTICLGMVLSLGSQLARAQDSSPKSFLDRLGTSAAPGPSERNHREVRQAFREVVREVNKATVRVTCQDLHAAFGTVVSSDGYVLTKASEMTTDIKCLLFDGRKLPAAKVGESKEHDLAVLKLNADNLPAITWSETSTLPVGSWLVTAGVKEYPAAIGVVSNQVRPIARPAAFLGIGMEQDDQGVRVNAVVPGSAADRAGFRRGDVIRLLAGDQVTTPDDVSKRVSSRQPGQQVRMEIQRGPDKLSITATLGNRDNVGGEDQAELMDSLGGPLSERRADFPAVVQHDTVLRPDHCGGPVVDLSGRVVGINIARASRVASYAIPADVIKPLLPELISGRYAAVSQPMANSQQVTAGNGAGGD